MGETEVDSNDCPVEPIKIIKAEVLWNPFDDIVPRISVQRKTDNGSNNLKVKNLVERKVSYVAIKTHLMHSTLTHKRLLSMTHIMYMLFVGDKR